MKKSYEMHKSIFMVLLGLLLAAPAFAVNKAPVKELIVASDGEFTTITAALASLPDPNPDTNPVVIKVMPGTYAEAITMKSNVHLQGAGKDVTTIEASSGDTITISSLTNVSVTDFTIKDNGISITSSSPIIKDNIFTGNTTGMASIQITSGSPVIESNTFKNISLRAILSTNGSMAIIKNNVIQNTGNWVITEWSSSSTIMGNTIEGAGDGMEISQSSTKIISNVMKNGYRGMYFSGPVYDGGRPLVKDNIITGSSNEDIYVGSGVTPLISSNVYSTFVGSGAVGAYNLKPDGTSAPLQ